MELIQGDGIQFRKAGGWEPIAPGEWRNGFYEGESQKCVFIRDASGDANEYWKHRIEIRKTANNTGA